MKSRMCFSTCSSAAALSLLDLLKVLILKGFSFAITFWILEHSRISVVSHRSFTFRFPQNVSLPIQGRFVFVPWANLFSSVVELSDGGRRIRKLPASSWCIYCSLWVLWINSLHNVIITDRAFAVRGHYNNSRADFKLLNQSLSISVPVISDLPQKQLSGQNLEFLQNTRDLITYTWSNDKSSMNTSTYVVGWVILIALVNVHLFLYGYNIKFIIFVHSINCIG